jgi:hypothetical protein
MLFPGQEILNRASIVFDVNEPVITNDAVFGVPLPEGLQDLTNGFDFYPNPADQSLIINADLNKGTVQLTDISGRIIVSQPITSKQTTIETSQIPAGVYFIELMVENRKLSNQKLIIAH